MHVDTDSILSPYYVSIISSRNAPWAIIHLTSLPHAPDHSHPIPGLMWPPLRPTDTETSS